MSNFVTLQIWDEYDDIVRANEEMKKYLVLPILAVLGYNIVLSFFVATAFAQDVPYTEEYMQQHDGGDRAEYLQEKGYSDPWFYVPPVNDVSMSTPNNVPAN